MNILELLPNLKIKTIAEMVACLEYHGNDFAEHIEAFARNKYGEFMDMPLFVARLEYGRDAVKQKHLLNAKVQGIR